MGGPSSAKYNVLDWGETVRGKNADQFYYHAPSGGHDHPWPVGFKAHIEKLNTSFEISIHEGPVGPVFKVVDLETKKEYTGTSASGPWKTFNAERNARLGTSTSVNGTIGYGFDKLWVVNKVRKMHGEQPIEDTNSRKDDRSSRPSPSSGSARTPGVTRAAEAELQDQAKRQRSSTGAEATPQAQPSHSPRPPQPNPASESPLPSAARHQATPGQEGSQPHAAATSTPEPGGQGSSREFFVGDRYKESCKAFLAELNLGVNRLEGERDMLMLQLQEHDVVTSNWDRELDLLDSCLTVQPGLKGFRAAVRAAPGICTPEFREFVEIQPEPERWQVHRDRLDESLHQIRVKLKNEQDNIRIMEKALSAASGLK